MNILDVHYGTVVEQELTLLASMDAPLRNNLNWETFNPFDSRNCFIGQTFGARTSLAADYRSKVGTIPNAVAEFHASSGSLGLTPLEIWSARMWKQDQHHAVKLAFDYVKSGGTEPMPEVVYVPAV